MNVDVIEESKKSITTDLENNGDLETFTDVLDELMHVEVFIRLLADRMSLQQYWDNCVPQDETVNRIIEEGAQLYLILRRLRELRLSGWEILRAQMPESQGG